MTGLLILTPVAVSEVIVNDPGRTDPMMPETRAALEDPGTFNPVEPSPPSLSPESERAGRVGVNPSSPQGRLPQAPGQTTNFPGQPNTSPGQPGNTFSTTGRPLHLFNDGG